MRAFVAIEIPQDIHHRLAEAQSRFKKAANSARWTSDFHLTLKFLGRITEEQVKAISKKLPDAGKFEKFRVQVQGFGFFPNGRRPNVFWAGVHAPPALAELAGRVQDAMADLGFEPEKREFRPHLTLARFREPRPQPALEAMLAYASREPLGSFEVSEFFLWESHLSPAGAGYRKVERFGGD